MKQLMLNDGRSVEVQSVSAADGIMHIRLILTTPEQLKAYFMDSFATSMMTLYKNGKPSGKPYENYTILEYIKEEAGGIQEVEMRQSASDTETRLTNLEDNAKQQAEELISIKEDVSREMNSIKQEIAQSGASIDTELFAASLVVARANAQALTDVQAVEAKALYPEWDMNSVDYEADYKVQHEGILYKCISEHTSQADWAPGAALSLWTAIESGEHTGSQEDPVPVPETVTTAGMEYEKGKYYSEGGAVYLMDRQGMEPGEKITLYFAPSSLIGEYFSIME